MPSVPHSLSTDRRTAPLGIGSAQPEFGWRLDGLDGQTAYEVQVATDQTFGAESIVWASEEIASTQPFGVRYSGAALASGTQYFWRVRVRLVGMARTSWSASAVFETGILDPGEWTAEWIAAPRTAKKATRTEYFRTLADLPAAVVRGRAYTTALGWYRLLINGRDLTGHALVPRWTTFHEFIEYQTYDVTDVFTDGINSIGMMVAEGRYRGRLGVMSKGARYGDRLAAFVQIDLDLADGSQVRIVTDDSWHVGGGRILTSDPKFGERVDLRVSDTAWTTPTGFTERETSVEILPRPPARIVAEELERVTTVGRRPGTVSRTPAGVQLVDFGQNFAGVARVRLAGRPGTRVRLEYSEVLKPDGELDTGYLELGKGDPDKWFQRDEAVLSAEVVDYTPRFTIHGFRYLTVEGLDHNLTTDDVEGIVLSSDLAQTGEFTASDSRLEQLWRNVVWSMRSNFTDTPSDCPTRERSGWTGDVQVFASTAAQLMDVDSYYRRFLENLRAEQYSDGKFPVVIPAEDSPGRGRNLLRFSSPSVGWGDVSVMLPWTLYEYYGDTEALRLQYASARRWVDSLARRAAHKRGLVRRFGTRVGAMERHIVDTGYHYGEWLRPGEPAGKTIAANFLGQPVVATAYLAHSAALLARIAGVLGDARDEEHYRSLSAKVATAWRAAFVRHGGARIGEDKQDEYVRALAFDLLLPDQRARASDRLVELIEQAGDHLGTGFLSTPMLLETLVDAGHPDVAYRVLLQDTAPSWLGQIERGATTTWETWEGYDADGNANLSHNHYAFGAVVRFLQERIAGLAPGAPGYRTLRIAPVIGGGLTSASAAVQTPYGRAASAWRLIGDEVELTVTVPAGVEAEIEFGTDRTRVGSGSHTLTRPHHQFA